MVQIETHMQMFSFFFRLPSLIFERIFLRKKMLVYVYKKKICARQKLLALNIRKVKMIKKIVNGLN